MKIREFEKAKSAPLDVVWRTRDASGIHIGKMLEMKVVFLERERRALEAKLGYPVDITQISAILRAILEGKIGLKEL